MEILLFCCFFSPLLFWRSGVGWEVRRIWFLLMNNTLLGARPLLRSVRVCVCVFEWLHTLQLAHGFQDISSQQLPDDFRNLHHYTEHRLSQGKLNMSQEENRGSVKRKRVSKKERIRLWYWNEAVNYFGFFIWWLWFCQHSRLQLNSAAFGKTGERVHTLTSETHRQPLPLYGTQIMNVERIRFIK